LASHVERAFNAGGGGGQEQVAKPESIYFLDEASSAVFAKLSKMAWVTSMNSCVVIELFIATSISSLRHTLGQNFKTYSSSLLI